MCDGPHPYIPVPGVVQVVVNQELAGEPIMNVYNVSRGSGPTPSTLEEIALLFELWWVQQIAPLVVDDLKLISVVVTDLETETSGRYVKFAPSSAVGAITTAPMPNNVALVISWTGAQRGRGSQGRTYHAGLADSQVEGSYVSSGIAASINAAYATIRSRLQTLSTANVQAIVSYCLGGVWRTVGVGTAITNSTAGTRVDTQRRRLPRSR